MSMHIMTSYMTLYSYLQCPRNGTLSYVINNKCRHNVQQHHTFPVILC